MKYDKMIKKIPVQKMKKICMLYALLVVSISANVENKVSIDLNTEILTSTEGLDINYGDMSLNVLNVQRDLKENKVYLRDRFKTKIFNPMGRVYFESGSGEVVMDGTKADFSDSYGTMEVGNITGAEYPNDKIYFGAKKIKYSTDIILMDNGWITTDPLIDKSKNPNNAGFYLLSDKLIVEQNKQITMKGVDFYKSGKSYLPFKFPCFKVIIRKD